MAADKNKKKRKASAPKAKLAKPAKLPKQIAGVKVPKDLREPGGRLVAALNNPIVIDLAAAALTAAATRFADNLRNPAAPAPAPPPQPAQAPSGLDVGALALLALSEGMRRLGTEPPRKSPPRKRG